MAKFPDKVYALLNEVFAWFEFSEEEIKKHTKDLEQALFGRFVDKTMRKLPKQERKPIVELANSGNKEELNKKMEQWFNKDEVKRMWQKSTTETFTEMLLNLYKDATEEQKKKLEEKFKPEIFKSS